MLDFGFIMLIIGSVLLIWQKLSAKAKTRALSPRTLLLRSSALEAIRVSQKRGYHDAYILIGIGIFLILIFGVVN